MKRSNQLSIKTFFNTNPFFDSKKAKNLEEQSSDDPGTQSNSEVGNADDESPLAVRRRQHNSGLDLVAASSSICDCDTGQDNPAKPLKVYRFQASWQQGRAWLKFDEKTLPNVL